MRISGRNSGICLAAVAWIACAVLAGTEAPIVFGDVAARAGVVFHHRSGGAEKEFLVETVGSGVALFDYNNDGLVDIYLVNGAQLKGGKVMPIPGGGSRLYKNLGHMQFQDVTAQARVGNQ